MNRNQGRKHPFVRETIFRISIKNGLRNWSGKRCRLKVVVVDIRAVEVRNTFLKVAFSFGMIPGLLAKGNGPQKQQKDYQSGISKEEGVGVALSRNYKNPNSQLTVRVERVEEGKELLTQHNFFLVNGLSFFKNDQQVRAICQLI